MAENYLAHVRHEASEGWTEHGLAEHLREVARRAGESGSFFGSSEWTALAGLWHDLGKFKPDFQAYIRSASGYQADAHLENIAGKVDHSTAGAILAVQRSRGVGRILAYLIAGHHSGLPDWLKANAEGRGLEERLKEGRHLEESMQAEIPEDILGAALPSSMPPIDPEYVHLWVRMLFSCLVDADFLDTEEFMDPERATRRGSTSTLEALRGVFQLNSSERDAKLQDRGEWDRPVNRIRRGILKECRRAADLSPGFFSLTVPTGGGKTLSSIAFALDHALRHGKRRIILAIPYTSIIEQTAEVLSRILGAENVLEHHSNLDPDRETPKGRLAAENWDAPIVVTTNVQLFESMYASRTSHCRKLHNLADSILILDEAQMLPPELLAPTLSALKGLVKHFGCTVVLCTATQPALVGEIGAQKAKFRGLSDVREIVPDPEALYQELSRVKLRFKSGEKSDWAALAEEMAQYPQVLCIVNRRKDCRDLWDALKIIADEKPVHLSALMCGEHRSKVIGRIKKDLVQGKPLRVISTQLVEAGVDIDFPVVYRAMAGLDSIAQAAGRCNREGRLEGRLGEVVVFNPPKPCPPGLLRKGEDAGFEVIRTWPDASGLLSPGAFRQYFKCFYGRVNDFGWESFKSFGFADAGSTQGQFQFRSAAQWYKLIDDQGQHGIVVWYETPAFSISSILDPIRRLGPSRDRMRRLQRFTVNVPDRIWKSLKEQGAIQELQGPEGPTGLWEQSLPGLYDPTFGLRLEGPDFNGAEFIC